MNKKRLTSNFLLPVLKVIILSGLFISKSTIASHKNDFLLSEANQKINVEQGKETYQRLTQWENMVFHDLGKTIQEKLKLVNDFFNQMQWADDKELWNKKDYWATPLESLIRNSGDCEDFAIAKYFTLLAMDVPEHQLKITFVRINNQLGHMVLFYYPENSTEPLILDNMEDKIVKQSERPELNYVFSFNNDGMWLNSHKTAQADEKNVIQKWAQMITKIKQE